MKTTDEQGQTLIIMVTAVSFVMVPLLALQLDGGAYRHMKVDLQSRADAAALSGALELCMGGNPDDVRDAAKAYSGITDRTKVQIVPHGAADGSDEVQVSLQSHSQRFMIWNAPVSASASASGCDPNLDT